MSKDEVRLPKRVRAVVNRVQGGEKVCKSVRLNKFGFSDIEYYYSGSGRKIGFKTAQAAIKSGLLAPSGDGLFEGEFSQTWGPV